MPFWKKIIPGNNPPTEVFAIIECPKGSRNKFEISKNANILILDRVLHSSVIYPHDYGFIPGTYASDGDPMDILVLISHPTVPMTIVNTKPIGVMLMEDEQGIDEKILSVAIDDPIYREYDDIVQIPKHFLDEILEFFRTYKTLEGSKYAQVKEWKGREIAFQIINESIERFKEKFGEIAKLIP